MVWYPVATGFWIDGIRHMFGIKCQGAGSHWVPILTLVFREFRDKKSVSDDKTGRGLYGNVQNLRWVRRYLPGAGLTLTKASIRTMMVKFRFLLINGR